MANHIPTWEYVKARVLSSGSPLDLRRRSGDAMATAARSVAVRQASAGRVILALGAADGADDASCGVSSRGDDSRQPASTGSRRLETRVDRLHLYEILIRQQSDKLRAFIRSIAFDRDLIEDVFQETVLVAWRQIDTFDRTKPIGPWLRGIARNCLLAQARKRNRAIIDDEAVIGRIDRQMAAGEGAEGDDFGEKSEALRNCMERLGTEQREAIDLCYIREMPATLAADVARITHDAMRKRLQRARADLLDCLRRSNVLESPA